MEFLTLTAIWALLANLVPLTAIIIAHRQLLKYCKNIVFTKVEMFPLNDVLLQNVKQTFNVDLLLSLEILQNFSTFLRYEICFCLQKRFSWLLA